MIADATRVEPAIVHRSTDGLTNNTVPKGSKYCQDTDVAPCDRRSEHNAQHAVLYPQPAFVNGMLRLPANGLRDYVLIETLESAERSNVLE